MAAIGSTPISLYYSTTAAATPTAGNLVNGELAINITDGKLYYKDNGGVVKLLAGSSSGPAGGSNTQVQFNSSGVLSGSSSLTWDGSYLTAASIKDTALTSGRVTYAGASGLLQDSANLTFNGTTLTAAGFSGPLNGTVGATTPSTGAFTTLSATGDLSFSTVGSKVNFATTASATVNYVGGSADGYSLEMVMQRGASQPLKYKQDYSVGHVWSIAGSDKLTLDSSGNLLVGVTSANANGGVLQLKSGITFPATQVAASDANTLDDYEEGTWTPSVGGTATYSLQQGTYVKIGRLVTVRCQLQITLIGTGSATTISGLPFTSATAETPISVGYFSSLAGSVGFIGGYVNNLASNVTFITTTANQATCTNSPNILGNSARIDFSVSYYVST